MTVRDGLEALLTIEKQKRKQVITRDTLVIGIARAGSSEPIVKAGYVEEMMRQNFGAPPHTLVFPGKLHFMEAEALIALAEAPLQIRERTR